MDPKHVNAFINRFVAKGKLGDTAGMIEDGGVAKWLDPNLATTVDRLMASSRQVMAQSKSHEQAGIGQVIARSKQVMPGASPRSCRASKGKLDPIAESLEEDAGSEEGVEDSEGAPNLNREDCRSHKGRRSSCSRARKARFWSTTRCRTPSPTCSSGASSSATSN